MGGEGTQEQRSTPAGTLQPWAALSQASSRAGRNGRQNGKGEISLDLERRRGGGGGKVVINLVSPRSSQGRLEFWRPSRSQAEGEVRGGRELGKGTGRGGREAALSSHPLHGQGLHAGRGPGVLRHPHFCHSVLSHSLLCRSEIMLTVQFM